MLDFQCYGNKINEFSILTYSEAYKSGISVVGGKAYSISKLYHNGFCVPDGMIFSVDFWKHIRECDSKKCLDRAIHFLTDSINGNRYAVRSSAVGEDSESHSWAGCFESVLDVLKNDLFSAILICGESLNGRRAKAYQSLHSKIAPITEIGILVQQFIEADWSGVSFSANPITGNRNEYVIEMQSGKSGSVVGGYGESVTIVLESNSLEFDSPKGIPNHLCLNLINILIDIQKLWEVPVDVEWVIQKEKIFVTQVRPITTI